MDQIKRIANIAVTRYETINLINECLSEIVEGLKAVLKDTHEEINMVYIMEKGDRFIIELIDRRVAIDYRTIDEKLLGGKKGKEEIRNALLEIIACGMVDVNIPTGV